MSRVLYIGLDNGVTSSYGFVTEGYAAMCKAPTKSEQSYTKKEGNITRIQVDDLKLAIHNHWNLSGAETVKVFLERMMINAMRFKASISAARALEATIIALEQMGLGFEYIDSKQWQKKILPPTIKGSADLKKASMDIGLRIYPQLSAIIKKHKDADGLLMAHWAYVNKL